LLADWHWATLDSQAGSFGMLYLLPLMIVDDPAPPV